MRGGICVAVGERPRMTTSGISERSRARQAAALQIAEHQCGKTRTNLAAELGLGYDQYARYVNGVTPLRVEQIEQFAYAYGIDPRVLGHAILTGDTAALPKWDIRAALREAGETDEARIEQFATTYEGRGIADQRAAVLDYQLDPASEQRDRSA